MNRALIEKIADAVLYEGYMLYPYRASSIKNRHRFNFGVLYPEGFDTSSQRTECLVCEEENAALDVVVRYLRLDASGQAKERAVEVKGLRLAALAESPHLAAAHIG